MAELVSNNNEIAESEANTQHKSNQKLMQKHRFKTHKVEIQIHIQIHNDSKNIYKSDRY